MSNLTYIGEKESVFFHATEGNGPKEAAMDFCLSYTFKMAEKRNHKDRLNEKLLRSCRAITSKLIGENIEDADFHVQTYMQLSNIDLIVELYIGEKLMHVLLIEDKVNNNLKEWQLPNQNKYVRSYYAKHKDIKIHSFVIKAVDYKTEEMMALCIKHGAKFFSMDELINGITEDTGNAIFDEFWLRDWE